MSAVPPREVLRAVSASTTADAGPVDVTPELARVMRALMSERTRWREQWGDDPTCVGVASDHPFALAGVTGALGMAVQVLDGAELTDVTGRTLRVAGDVMVLSNGPLLP